MKIGDVEERLGLPASTIRYYERVGLIDPPPRRSGRRDFDARSLFLLRFVQLSQAAGFTIAETKSLLESYAEDPSPGGMWNSMAADKRAAIQAQIGELQQMDRILAELMSCRCATLEECVEKGCARSAGD